MKSVLQGSRAVPTVIVDAGVGQAVAPKNWPTVCASVIEFRFVGLNVVSNPVPTVLGKLVLAKATNAGSAKVCPPAIVELAERSGSTSKKKKNWWCGIIGPPMPKAMLLP